MDVFDLLKETGKVDCSTMQGLQDIFEKHGIVESKSLELAYILITRQPDSVLREFLELNREKINTLIADSYKPWMLHKYSRGHLKLLSEYNLNTLKTYELDCILSAQEDTAELINFLECNRKTLATIIPYAIQKNALFTPQRLSAYPRELLAKISEFADLYIAGYVILRDIPDNIRALFWHRLYRLSYCNVYGNYYCSDLIRECDDMRKSLRVYDMQYLYRDYERKFIEMTHGKIRYSSIPKQLYTALANDSISAFEMSRLIHNKSITSSLVLETLQYGAKKIFKMLLDKYSGKLFKIHSPAEWLFIICNKYAGEVAIEAVREIEKRFPGTVRSARDPWNANLLWNTFFNRSKKMLIYELQDELINLGCDPDEKNDLGLSFNLLMENTPEKWERELGLCVES